ncbi:MAG: ACP S-malonyltransferase [Pseudomonadota bacterium]
MKKKALVIAPGRGTYNKAELGYLHRHHGDKADLIADLDRLRQAAGQVTLSELDQASRFVLSTYSRGDNASSLIHACAYADFLSIDRRQYDIAAITGNSMGWYIALGCAGALSPSDSFTLINTMGTLMHEASIGGQMIYPFVDDHWFPIPGKREELLRYTDEISDLYLSIQLGGMIVFGGSSEALNELERRLEPLGDRFPMRLANHAAFHTPLQHPVSAQGRKMLPVSMFKSFDIPLIDGRGHVWYPQSTDNESLWSYTLGHQVVAPYVFSSSVINGVKEFAPDVVIVLGPGTTLGGAVAQALIQHRWKGLQSKDDFIERQGTDPLVLAMGMDAQRELVTSGA